MNWLFVSGGQSTGASALASVLPVNIKGWFPLGLTALIKHKISCVTVHWQRRLNAEELMLLHCGTGEDPWGSLGQKGDPNSHIFRCSDAECMWKWSCSVVSDSLRPHGLYSPWSSPGRDTGVGSRSLLQGVFPTQGSNPGPPHCRQMLYHLSHQGSMDVRVEL